MKKYYAHANNSQTLRSVKAESDEEAFEKFKEIFRNDDFVAGTLPRAGLEILWKEKRRYYAAGFSAIGAGKDTFESAMKTIDNLHQLGAF